MAECRFIDTVVGRLAVHPHGHGAEPTVLWHSLFVDERSWDRVVPALGAERRLILITGPGHGESGDPGRRYSNSDCSRAAAQVLDALDIREPVNWVGNAWGGHVGILLAAADPGRVRSLVTIGTPVQSLSRRERTRTVTLLLLHRLLGPAPFIVKAVSSTLLSPTTRATDRVALELVNGSFAAANRRRLRNAVVSISLHREDLTAVLPSIQAPILMITGAQHAGWTPEQASAIIATLPGGHTAVVSDAAYLAPLERSAQVADLLREFWARLPDETVEKRP